MDQPHNYQLLSELFDGQPQVVMWFKPVWNDDDKHITDFEVRFCNKAAQHFLQLTNNHPEGTRFSALTNELQEDFFPHMEKVYRTGHPSESDIYHAGRDKFVKVLRTKVRNGVLVVVQDRTDEYKMQQEVERRKAFSESILNASLYGVMSCVALRDEFSTITDLRYVYLNDKAEVLLHRTAEEILGQTMLGLFPQARENGLFHLCRRVMETQKPRRAEIYFNTNGLHGWHEISAAPLDGNGIVITSADITSQKEAALERERQKTLLDNILKHSPIGISVIEAIRDEEGRVVNGRTIISNEMAARFSGMSLDNVMRRTFREKVPTLFDSSLFHKAVLALETGEPFYAQHYFERPGNWLGIAVSKLDDEHLIAVFRDITETKEAQLQLEKSLEELRRSNVSLEDFAHAASHDLKEPIRKIQTFAERLKSSLTTHMTEREAHIFERLENATQRMRLLVDDLLEYSHVSHRPRQKDNVDLNKKVQIVLTDLEVEIEEKSARIHIDPLPVVKGYKRQLQQLFQNLVSNALKYSQPGVPPEITITARKVIGQEVPITLMSQDHEKPFHLIEVRDNGIGFEPEYAERIFHMFQRLHGKSEYPGTGVGLSIARKVAENHDGYLWARSEPDQGATFFVLLPAGSNGTAD